MSIFIVDVEATSPTPMSGVMTEFAAVEVKTGEIFYGKLYEATPHPDNPALPVVSNDSIAYDANKVMGDFEKWLDSFPGYNVFLSDNPAFDFMWIACLFDQTLERNPFGFSARRIGDYYAGFKGNWRKANDWKKYRKTVHDHNPVNDVKGNREAFLKIMEDSGQDIGKLCF